MEGEIHGKIEKLKRFLERQDFVRAAYLFGSFAKNKHGPLSDLDFAVLLDRKLSRRDMTKKRAVLMDRFSEILGTDNFDLVVINTVTLLMKYNIIKEGKPLKSTRERPAFEARVVSDYLDRKPYDDMYAAISLERFSKKGVL